jgi:hypothetical protein
MMKRVFKNVAMALTWPTTFDIFNVINSQCNYNNNPNFRRKKLKMGEIGTMDLSATNSIEAHD